MNRKQKKAILALNDKELDKAVKIAGTQYDRKRKISDKQIDAARKLVSKGKSFEYIIEKLKLNVTANTIRYHLDEAYRRYRIDHANYGKGVAACKRGDYNEILKDRAAYKRKLVARGRVSV